MESKYIAMEIETWVRSMPSNLRIAFFCEIKPLQDRNECHAAAIRPRYAAIETGRVHHCDEWATDKDQGRDYLQLVRRRTSTSPSPSPSRVTLTFNINSTFFEKITEYSSLLS
jgi:hypothetical protein